MALPLPKVVADVGPGGPFVTSARGLNALKMDQSAAEYAPYTNYANALSKIAYGQTAPANAIAQLLASPAAANMDKGLYQQLVGQANNSLRGMNSNILPNPQNNSGIFGNSLAGKAFSSLLQKIMPQGEQGTNPLNMSQTRNDFTPVDMLPPGSNNTDEAGNSVGYNTPFSRQSANSGVPGSMGANNPSDINKANAAAQTTTATGQAANQNELQKARSQTISQQSQAATQALKSLKGFSRNYDKSSYKGQYLGNKAEQIPSPPGGNVSPEQLANRYANQYLSDLSALGDTPAGKTDDGRELIASGKFDLSLDPGAKKEMIEGNEAKLNRIANSRNFSNDFYRRNPGATDEELIGLMNAYNRYAPSYDYEKGKSLPQNEKKFKDFTSPEALNSYRNNGDYNPYEGKNTGTIEKQFDLTKFKDDADFNQWFQRQNEDTQDYVKRQIEAGVY